MWMTWVSCRSARSAHTSGHLRTWRAAGSGSRGFPAATVLSRSDAPLGAGRSRVTPPRLGRDNCVPVQLVVGRAAVQARNEPAPGTRRSALQGSVGVGIVDRQPKPRDELPERVVGGETRFVSAGGFGLVDEARELL